LTSLYGSVDIAIRKRCGVNTAVYSRDIVLYSFFLEIVEICRKFFK